MDFSGDACQTWNPLLFQARIALYYGTDPPETQSNPSTISYFASHMKNDNFLSAFQSLSEVVFRTSFKTALCNSSCKAACKEVLCSAITLQELPGGLWESLTLPGVLNSSMLKMEEKQSIIEIKPLSLFSPLRRNCELACCKRHGDHRAKRIDSETKRKIFSCFTMARNNFSCFNDTHRILNFPSTLNPNQRLGSTETNTPPHSPQPCRETLPPLTGEGTQILSLEKINSHVSARWKE